MRKAVTGFALVAGLAAIFATSAFATGSAPTTSVYQNGGVSIQKSLGTLKPPSTPTTPAPTPTSNTVNAASHTTTTPTTPASTTPASTTPSGVAGASTSKPGAQLPFTGLDLGLFVAAGLFLIAMGFGLRRLSRKPPAA
jgi:hypothetical protein